MKVVKKIILVFFILIALIIVGLVLTPVLFKDKLVEIAKQEINNQVNASIEFGEFDLSVFRSFPDLNFQIHDVKAIGKDDFENDTLIDLKKLEADVNLMSVFGDVIKVNTIVIDEAVINAKVLEGGKANWDIAVESSDTTVVEEEEVSSEESAFNLKLQKLAINHTNIVYDDRDMDVYTKIEDLNFTLEGDLTMENTSLKTYLLIDKITTDYEGVKYLNKANVEVNADIDADLVKYKFVFNENTFRINFLELGMNGWVEMPEEDIDMDISFSANKTEFKNILSLVPAIYAKDFESVQTKGKLALNAMAKGRYSENTLPAFNLDLQIEDAMFKYPDLPGAAEGIQVDLNVSNPDGIDDHTLVDLKKFHIDFEKNPIDARLKVKTPVSNPDIDAWLKGSIDLAKMGNVIPMDDMNLNGIINADFTMKGTMDMIDNERYEDFEALGNIGIENLKYESEDLPQAVNISKADMIVAPQFFTLQQFNASMGKSDFSMSGKIEDFLAYVFRDELIKGEFLFNSRNLDLNELAGNDEETVSETGAETTEAESEEDMEVIEVPANIDFKLTTTIGTLRYDNMDIKNISGLVAVKDGIADLSGLKMNLLQGAMQVDGKYNTQTVSKPSVDFALDIKGFDIPTTYQTFNTIEKLAPVTQYCEGKFNIKFDYTSDLQANMDPDYATIQGYGKLQTKQIKVSGSKAQNLISEKLKMDKLKTLVLNDVNISFEIKDGRIYVDPFTTKYSKSEFTISGSQGVDQSLDYTMHMKVPRSEFGGQANAFLNDLASQASGKSSVNVELGETIEFDVLIGGTVSDPKISVDMGEQAKSAVEDIKEQVVDKVKEEVDKAKQQAIAKARAQKAKLVAEAKAKGDALVKKAETTANQAKAAARKAAEKVKNEAYSKAKDVENAAKGKPKPLRDAAKKSADKIRKEADKQYNNAMREAETKANRGVNEAKKQKTELINKASKEGDRLIQKAENS